jgi:hypothetical protein
MAEHTPTATELPPKDVDEQRPEGEEDAERVEDVEEAAEGAEDAAGDENEEDDDFEDEDDDAEVASFSRDVSVRETEIFVPPGG